MLVVLNNFGVALVMGILVIAQHCNTIIQDSSVRSSIIKCINFRLYWRFDTVIIDAEK